MLASIEPAVIDHADCITMGRDSGMVGIGSHSYVCCAVVNVAEAA